MIMKHKTIRQNVFETNSSSTHSVTLCIPENIKPNYKPYSDTGILDVGVTDGYWYAEAWNAKLTLLGAYLIITNRMNDLEKIEQVISDFTGMKVIFNKESVEKLHKSVIDFNTNYPKEDYLSDHFYNFLKNQYETIKIEEFTSLVEQILESNEMIIGFVCSDGWFNVCEYYDG